MIVNLVGVNGENVLNEIEVEVVEELIVELVIVNE